MKYKTLLFTALMLMAGRVAQAEQIGSVDTVFKMFGPDHKIVVDARREHGLFISRLLLYLIHIHEPPLLWSIFLCSDVTIFNELGFGGPLKCHH